MTDMNARELSELEDAIGWPVADGRPPTEDGREFCREYGHAADFGHWPSPICMRCGELR